MHSLLGLLGRGGGGGSGDGQPSAAEFLKFYRREGKDSRGRTLEEIWTWDDESLERVHDWVQWVFPSDEESMFNPFAPDFPPDLQEKVKKDAKIMSNLRKSFDVYLAFLGFRYNEENRSVERTDSFEEKASNWLQVMFGPNHNWLRLSRVLNCMRLVGETDRKDALYMALERVYVEGRISGRFSTTMEYWQKYAGIQGRAIPAQAERPTPESLNKWVNGFDGSDPDLGALGTQWRTWQGIEPRIAPSCVAWLLRRAYENDRMMPAVTRALAHVVSAEGLDRSVIEDCLGKLLQKESDNEAATVLAREVRVALEKA